MVNSGSGPAADKPAKRGLADKIKDWAANHLLFVFAILRCLKPILVLKELAVVTRFAHVQEVMSRDDAFNVTYEKKMRVVAGGSNFFLGMGPTPIYQRDVSNMRLAIRRTDVETIVVPMVEKFATEIVDQAGGQIDAVHDLSRIVPAMLVEQYMGVSGPTRDDLIEWTSNLFYYLFFPNISEEANRIGAEQSALARDQIDIIIAARKESGEQKDDALGRLLQMQQANLPGLTDADIRNNLLGIIIGAIPTTSKSAALVLDYLLDNPETMRAAKAVAQQNDLQTLNKYVLESLRFNYFGPGLFRDCTQDYVVGKGSWRATKIPKGTRVFVSTLSGMWDGREIKKPKRFDINRPHYQYMHYGYGMHTCFGQYINDVQIAIIVKSLLVKDNLQRAAGDAGKLQWNETKAFPTRLRVTFSP